MKPRRRVSLRAPGESAAQDSLADLERAHIGTVEDVDKLNRRQVKVTRQHNEECQKLLTLMGIPWITVSL